MVAAALEVFGVVKIWTRTSFLFEKELFALDFQFMYFGGISYSLKGGAVLVNNFACKYFIRVYYVCSLLDVAVQIFNAPNE